MEARTAGPGQRLGHVDAQCYDGEPEPETDTGRIFERIAEVIESVAVVEEGGHAEVMREIPDDLEGPGDEVLAAVPDGPDLLHAFARPGDEDGTVLVPRAHRIDRAELIVGEAPDAVIAAGEE